MTPDQKKLLRAALVTALCAAAPLGISLPTLKGAAKAAGFRLEDEALERELDYLVKSGLAAIKREKLSAAAVRWESTAAAVEYAESEGLI